jgi:hypothetical protein
MEEEITPTIWFQYGRYAVLSTPDTYLLKNMETQVVELSTPTLFNAMQWAIKSENAVLSVLKSIETATADDGWTAILDSATPVEPKKNG